MKYAIEIIPHDSNESSLWVGIYNENPPPDKSKQLIMVGPVEKRTLFEDESVLQLVCQILEARRWTHGNTFTYDIHVIERD